ncbi:hypothetical protein Droror1_Dr00017567 [Drosera rotundifolia]
MIRAHRLKTKTKGISLSDGEDDYEPDPRLMEHRSSQPLVVENARHDLRWGSSWATSCFSFWPTAIDLVERTTEVATVSGINWEGSGAVVSSPGQWRRCRRCVGKTTTL